MKINKVLKEFYFERKKELKNLFSRLISDTITTTLYRSDVYLTLFFVNLISESYRYEVFIEYTKMFAPTWGGEIVKL